VCEPIGLVAKFDVHYAHFESEDTYDVVHNIVENPLEGCCDVFVHEASSSWSFDKVLPNPLDESHVYLMCSQPSFFSVFYCNLPIDNHMIRDATSDLGYEDNMFDVFDGNIDNFLSLGYFSGYDASVGRYYIYLVDKPKKIMWNTFINFSFDFSMALALLKKVPILFRVIVLMLSYNHAYEPYAEVF